MSKKMRESLAISEKSRTFAAVLKMVVDHSVRANGNRSRQEVSLFYWLNISCILVVYPYAAAIQKDLCALRSTTIFRTTGCAAAPFVLSRLIKKRIMKEKEIWKDIKGCEGKYQVSNMGRIRSRCKKNEWRLRVFDYNRFGYAAVHFHFSGKDFRKYVHRLVAEAFVPGYREGLFVNHINENKQDNRVSNLEWVTTKYNNNYGSCPKHKSESLLAKKPLYSNIKVQKPSTEEDLEGEIWRDVVGYEGLYKVSNKGRVKSLRRLHINGGIMRQFRDVCGHGRLNVRLCNENGHKQMIVARIVAMAFVKGYKKGMEVNHINEDCDDNRSENLMWCTPEYNKYYGTRTVRSGISQRKPVVQLSLDDVFVAEFDYADNAAKALGGKNGSAIRNCCRGGIKAAYGYKWKYKEDYKPQK